MNRKKTFGSNTVGARYHTSPSISVNRKKIYGCGRNNAAFLCILFMILLVLPFNGTNGQSRIPFAGRNIFISGMNVAWVNFASDLGPYPIDTSKFAVIFDTVSLNGGNIMRLWLNTDGTRTPQYDASGKVTGPGVNAVEDLKTILSIAHRYNIGLQLCLWSHDMMHNTLSQTVLDRNTKFLTDTSYTMAYIRNALIPMVDAARGNPAVAGWEVFNEPEGFSDEFGWSDRVHVPMADIERVINLIAGAIHRADPEALVTSGANSIQSLTDVQVMSKISAAESINSLSEEQKESLTKMFNATHRTDFTVSGYISYLIKIAALPNENYYRDDRLIAAGGDTAGTLDYYNVHFYGSQAQSPFNHPFTVWQLKKPLVVGEFFMQDTYGVPYQNLYEQLYLTGYAGAMSWQWWGDTQANDNAKNQNHERTLASLRYMFDHYRNDILVKAVTGTIYSFTADETTIEKGDSTTLRWDVESGSAVTLNGESVDTYGSITISPTATTVYTLLAEGTDTSSAAIIINVLPTGRILSFKALPSNIGYGESTKLIWQTVKGSSVTLNGKPVSSSDTLIVHPDTINHYYTLTAQGDIRDSAAVNVTLMPPDQVDRALGGAVSVSSNDTAADSFSRPENVNDGSIYTVWQAAAGGGQWMRIDMGESIEINKIVIYWGSQGYARQYSIQTSDDLSSWETAASQYNGTGGTNNVETLENLAVSGRYVIILLQVPGVNACSIKEMEVYGKPAVTGIAGSVTSAPDNYSLSQNYPNPFNPSTTINYNLTSSGMVTLKVYNILGQQIAVLVNKEETAGHHSAVFNLNSAVGGVISSGVYFYRLKAGGFVQTKKMMVIK